MTQSQFLTNEVVLAADLGGTNLRMAAVGQDGEILSRVKLKTPESGRRDAIVDVITEAANEFLTKNQINAAAVSLALPGVSDSETGKISKAPNLPDLEGFAIGSVLDSRIGLPIIIENDGNAAAIGENWLGASKSAKSSIMVTLGTGVGGGIILDGKIIRGIDGTAGEIGHINVEPEGIPCGCGSHGCIEQYASATAIVNMALKAGSEKTGLPEEELRGIDSNKVFELAAAGNDWAAEIFRTQGYYLGIALAGLINCLNPEIIVIGGGVVAAWDAFVPEMNKQLGIRAYAEPVATAKIVPALLGDNAGIIGAAKLGFERINALKAA